MLSPHCRFSWVRSVEVSLVTLCTYLYNVYNNMQLPPKQYQKTSAIATVTTNTTAISSTTRICILYSIRYTYLRTYIGKTAMYVRWRWTRCCLMFDMETMFKPNGSSYRTRCDYTCIHYTHISVVYKLASVHVLGMNAPFFLFIYSVWYMLAFFTNKK